VATLGLVLVAGLVALNWATVRDHAEAWWFIATRETETVSPVGEYDARKWPFSLLAGSVRLPVIFDPAENKNSPLQGSGDSVLGVLQADGFRVIEQRFPRRAYVVVGYPEPREAPARTPESMWTTFQVEDPGTVILTEIREP
jgi:hypothetical protein